MRTSPKAFKWWAHKILPLVYDDSLSYYEFLCKVMDKLNEIIAHDQEQDTAIEKNAANIEVNRQEIKNLRNDLGVVAANLEEEIRQRTADSDEFRSNITALFTDLAPEYDTEMHYDVGDIVLHDGQLYEIMNEVQAGTAFKDADTMFTSVRDLILKERTEREYLGDVIGEWDINTTYYKNNCVSYNGEVYKCIVETVPAGHYFDAEEWEAAPNVKPLVKSVDTLQQNYEWARDGIVNLTQRMETAERNVNALDRSTVRLTDNFALNYDTATEYPAGWLVTHDSFLYTVKQTIPRGTSFETALNNDMVERISVNDLNQVIDNNKLVINNMIGQLFPARANTDGNVYTENVTALAGMIYRVSLDNGKTFRTAIANTNLNFTIGDTYDYHDWTFKDFATMLKELYAQSSDLSAHVSGHDGAISGLSQALGNVSGNVSNLQQDLAVVETTSDRASYNVGQLQRAICNVEIDTKTINTVEVFDETDGVTLSTGDMFWAIYHNTDVSIPDLWTLYKYDGSTQHFNYEDPLPMHNLTPIHIVEILKKLLENSGSVSTNASQDMRNVNTYAEITNEEVN